MAGYGVYDLWIETSKLDRFGFYTQSGLISKGPISMTSKISGFFKQ